MTKNKLWLISVLTSIFIIALTGCGSLGGSCWGNKWLSLSANTSGPRYLIDSMGRPFQMFGMARCQYHARDTEDPAYGGAAGVAQHFKALGCNSIRLALSFNTYTDQATDRIVQCGGYNETGIRNYIKEYVDPDVQAIIAQGMYIVLNLHMYPPSDPNPANTIRYAEDHFIPVWRELAERYKDEPMIAVFELWNEPYPADQGGLSLGPDGRIASGPYTGYDWSGAVRQFYIDCAAAIRQYDTQHILLLSDYNAGWGTAWPVTWNGYEYAADPVFKKVIYSIHAAASQLDNSGFSYYNSWWANTATNHNICFHFGEVETEDTLMNITAMQNYVHMLDQRRNSHHYSSFLWRPHDDVSNYAGEWTGFAKGYASAPDINQ